MVKGYDPTVNDPSKIVLQYLLRWSATPNPLTLQEAQKYVKFWLKNSSSTSQIYKKFQTLDDKTLVKPQVVLKKKCNQMMSWSYLKKLFNNQKMRDENYPASIEDNKIIVCLNLITNKTQLKQNIDRELTIYLRNSQKQSQKKKHNINKGNSQPENRTALQYIQQRDKQLMENLYEGCKQGYRNYMFDKEVQERISKKCAKYLFFRRCERKLPWDAKFRYASKIVDQIL